MTEDVEPRATQPATSPFVAPGDRAPIGLRVQGRYRIVSELGTGDFGTVCVAEDEATGHPVAIRLLPRGLAAAPQAGQAILRMGRSIVEASTAHRGLVRVLEFGEAEPGRLFMVMELLEGRRLSEILSADKPLSVSAALGLALDLAGPVETLHNMGLVHGGLRPRNVMVLKDGRVKLLDVELTGVRDLRALDGVINAEPPAEYLSPEQINRMPVTEKTDIYAFGVILYEMLCGAPPFRAATRAALLAKHQTETPVLLRRRRRAIPGSVEHVVMQALAKRPERRPLMPDLLDPLWAEAHGPTKRWRRTAAIVAGAGVAASIAVLVAWSVFAPRLSALRPLVQPAPAAVPQRTLAPPPPQLAQPAPPQLAQPALPPAVERAPVSSPPAVPAPAKETRTTPAIGSTTPALVTPAAARPAAPPAPQSAPPPARVEHPEPPKVSPAPKAERAESPRVQWKAPTGAASDRQAPTSDTQADDPGAVIDWLLKGR